MPDEAKLMPSATLATSIVQIINKLYFQTVPDVLHERLWTEMIATIGAGRDRIVRSNQCVSPLLAVCHEAALAPEEGGVPACGEDRRVANGTEGSPTCCMKASMVCVKEVADTRTSGEG